jgi:clan AA aspartic protease
MGEVRVEVELTNVLEAEMAKRGMISKDEVHRLKLDMLADTGAVVLLLPQEVIEKLQLPQGDNRIVVLADDRKIELRGFHSLMVKIGDRRGYFDCLEGPPNCEALIGQIVLESLDLIVDPLKRKLTPRPESPFLPLIKLKQARLKINDEG